MIETGFADLPNTIHDTDAVSTTGENVTFTPIESEQPLAILDNPVQDRVNSPELTKGTTEVNPPHNEQAYAI